MGELRIERIAQIAINAHDVGRAAAFYREKVGLEHLFDAGRLSFFRCGDVRLMISAPEKPEFDHPSSIVYFAVQDIRSTHTEMKARGVVFEDEPHLIARLPHAEVWMAFFRDSENNLMAITSEVPSGADANKH